MASRAKIGETERRRRIELIVRMLASGYRHGEIKQQLARAYGMKPRSIERYITAAKKEMVEAVEAEDKNEIVSRHVEFYRQCLRDTSAEWRDRLRAAQQLEQLMSLQQATRVELTGKDGGPVEYQYADLEREITEIMSGGDAQPDSGNG